MVDSSMHKAVVERGGGSTEVDTAAAAVVAAPTTPATPTTPTTLPPSSPPSFSYSSHHLIYRPLRRLEPQ